MTAGIRFGITRANGLDHHHASAGDPGRTLLLFLHGFPEAWFGWEEQLQRFGRDYFVLAPDLPGYNLSDKSKDLRGYRGGVIVRDLSALVEALGYRSLHLVGHDWGGALAYAWAMARPDQVRSLFILNAAHPYLFWRELTHNPAQASHSQYINILRQPAEVSGVARDNYAFLREFFHQDGAVPDWFDAVRQARYVTAWSQPGALDGALNYYRASPLYPATGEDAGAAKCALDPLTMQVTVPTTVLWGERDRFLLPGCIDGITQVVPEVRLIRHAQGSHWLAHEFPEVLEQHLREHLARVGARDGS
jgi:pimeloyl-ACP methyl ester carboxylesterase